MSADFIVALVIIYVVSLYFSLIWLASNDFIKSEIESFAIIVAFIPILNTTFFVWRIIKFLYRRVKLIKNLDFKNWWSWICDFFGAFGNTVVEMFKY